jgi:S1-C subfamily serine protease
LIQAGDKDRGDDFSIWEAETKEVFVVIPLGDNEKLSLGSEVIDIASPMGLGKQYFIGYISSPHVDRPPLDAGAVKWHDVMLVMIGSGPGSSGSAIVSTDQKAIVGFLVGGMGEANIGAIVVPVDSFKEFEKLVDTGKYKKTPATPERFLGPMFGQE